MATDKVEAIGSTPGAAAGGETFEPSFGNALPHYLPLLVFPLIVAAAIHGGWWIAAPFVFFALAGPLDEALGAEERNMDPAATPDNRLLAYHLPVWLWAALWPPTLVFGLWQILVSGDLSVWEGVLMAVVLTTEAQAVFIVGHELIHRRSVWERRVGEFLLASASYPQYATEHIYIHHALVGTPMDYGSAPKGPELLELFPARGGEQRHRRVAGRARAAGAPRPAGLALRQSVLALRDRDRLLVRADLVDGRVVGRAGLRRALPRRGPVDEAQQLHPALRAEARPAARRPVRAGRAPPFLERQLQVQQLDVLQHAAPPGSSRGLEPALPGAPAPRRGRIAATARELRQDVRAGRIPAPLVPDDGPAGRRMARAVLSRDRGLERLRQPGLLRPSRLLRGHRRDLLGRAADDPAGQPVSRAARRPRRPGIHRSRPSQGFSDRIRRPRRSPGAASRASTGRTNTPSPR